MLDSFVHLTILLIKKLSQLGPHHDAANAYSSVFGTFSVKHATEIDSGKVDDL